MDPSGEERDQMQEDIERLNLVLQVESSDFGIHEDDTEDIEMCINEDSIDHDDNESISSAYSLNSEGKPEVPSEMDQVSGMSEISHLPINAETCLALNRTYQELILESLKKIELALNENREKQKLLEEGLENKSKGSSKTADSSTTNKKKSSSLFCKPYFKDKDHKAAPPNSDVAMKRSLQEQKQDITPPLPWSYAQRCKLEEAVKEEGLKQKILPLMNRKEVLIERVKNLETDLMRINLERSIQEEENSDEEEDEHLTEKRKMKELELTEWQQKIEELDKDIEKTKETSETELLFGVDCEKVDWLMIANVIFAGKRDERECEIMWKNVLQPSINKEKWSTQETKQLQELAKKYNMRNWPAIAKELGTGRTPFQCLQFYQHNLNETWDNRPWTEEEDEMLKEVVESVRVGKMIYFSQVSYFLDGRSKSQCMARWKQINPNTKRGKWTLHEDCLLITAVQLHGTKNWSLIQEYVPGRTAVQCRDRYNHSLDPSIQAPEKWTYEEDKKLLKLVNKQTEDAPGNSIRWVKMTSEFPGRTDHQLLSRYKRLQNWKMKSSWVADQTLHERQSMGVLEGEQLLKEITREKPSTYLKDATKKLFRDINKEDYIKQMEDKKKGELVVPRPPVVLRSTSRCFQAVWDRKKQLFDLVNQHLENVEKILPHHGTSIEEFKLFDNLNTGQQKTLQMVMSNRPNKITVKDMLKLSRRLAKTGNCKEARAKRQEKDTLFDDQAKDILIWKCFHSLFEQKKIGRPRKFYLFSPTGRKPACAEDDDEEDVEKITDITFTLLMNALDVDYKGALEKSRQVEADNPALKEDIAYLKRITPKILPSNIKQRDPACTVNLGASTSQSQLVNPATSHNLVHQREPVNSDCPATAQSTVTATTTRQSSVENAQNQSDSSLQPTSKQHRAAAEAKTDSRLARKRKEPRGEDLNKQVLPKKLKTISAAHENTKGQSESGEISSVFVQGKDKACSQSTSKNNKCPETNADQSVSSTSGSPSPSPIPSSTPRGARIIKLPPGVKLKPGDKIQDVLAAHKLSMESLQYQQPPSGPRPNSQTSQSQPNKQIDTVRKPRGATKSKKQKHDVVVIRPPTGIQDPKKVKILPPGTITTSAFKNVLLHRKYLMVKADALYNRQFYKHRGEELQRRIELSKQADAEITKIESAKHAGALNETLNTTENSVVSDVAIKTAKGSQRSIVRHDALAKVRRTKEYKMLQKRFEALFAWPALLSTICPKNTDNSSEETNPENPTTSNRQVLNEEKTQKATAKPFKRKVTRTNYPCVSSKNAWRKRVMSREMKKFKKEARWRKLKETREKKLRGEYIPKKYIRKKPVKTTAIRKSQRLASRIDSFQTKKGPSVFNERKMVFKEEQTSQQNNSNSFQIQPGNVAIPVALIGNISSSFVNNNGENREEDHTVNMPQTHIEPPPITSGLLPSTFGNGETVVTSSLPQEVVLPTMTVTDMHIQTLPSTVSYSGHPLIIAVLPSDSRQMIQAVENRPLQGEAVNTSNLNHVSPDKDQR